MILECITEERLPISTTVLPPDIATNHYQCRHCGRVYHSQIVCPYCQCLTQPYLPILTLEDELLLSEILDKALAL